MREYYEYRLFKSYHIQGLFPRPKYCFAFPSQSSSINRPLLLGQYHRQTDRQWLTRIPFGRHKQRDSCCSDNPVGTIEEAITTVLSPEGS
jgi:hypothetical protein